MNMIIELVAEEQKRHVSMFDEYAIVNVWQTGWQMIAFRSHFVGINIYVIYLQIVEFGIKKQAIKMSINLVKWVVYSSYAWKKPLVITFYLQWMQISIKRCFGNWLTWSIIRINQRHFSPLFVTFNQMFADQYKKKLVCDIVVRSHEANWRQFLSTSHHFRY